MDDGKRAAAKAKFMELLPTRADVGNKRFRANVRFFLIEEFGCTDNAASTHYNHAFQECKKTNPELLGPVTGAAGEVPALGRPEGKNNGGRKKKVVETATNNGTTTDAETVTETTTVAETTAPAVEVELVNVYKKKNNELVMLGVTRAEAEAAIAKAAAAKKATLIIA